MNSYKFYVEIGGLLEGTSVWTSSSSQTFQTIVQARNPTEATAMVQGQYGGPDRCRVRYLGPA
jgi:hypothetical protein